MDESFEDECRRKFLLHCAAYRALPFHVDKRVAAQQAWDVIDTWLEWNELQAL